MQALIGFYASPQTLERWVLQQRTCGVPSLPVTEPNATRHCLENLSDLILHAPGIHLQEEQGACTSLTVGTGLDYPPKLGRKRLRPHESGTDQNPDRNGTENNESVLPKNHYSMNNSVTKEKDPTLCMSDIMRYLCTILLQCTERDVSELNRNVFRGEATSEGIHIPQLRSEERIVLRTLIFQLLKVHES